MVLTDFQAGHLDQARAAVFVDCLSGLDDEMAHEIAERYLVKARTLTPAQLRERLRYAVGQADPDRARRAYLRAVPERAVWLQPFTDGTAFLGACNLPPHLAAAAFNYLDRLARAAKALGDPRTLPQLRADVYLALLSGETFRYQPPVDPLSQLADEQAAADGTVVDDPDDLAGRTPEPTPQQRRPRYRRLRPDDDTTAAAPSPTPPAGRAPRRRQGPIPPPGRTQLPNPAPPGNQVVPHPSQQPLRSQVPPRDQPLRAGTRRAAGTTRAAAAAATTGRTGLGPTGLARGMLARGRTPRPAPRRPRPRRRILQPATRTEPGTGPDSATRSRTRFRIWPGNRTNRPQWTIRNRRQARPDGEADARLRRPSGRRRRRCPPSRRGRRRTRRPGRV